MIRPEGKQPFVTDKDGTEQPLFVPPAMLEEARAAAPRLWIEPTPQFVSGNDEKQEQSNG